LYGEQKEVSGGLDGYGGCVIVPRTVLLSMLC